MRQSTHRDYIITNQKVLTATEQESLVRVCHRTLDLDREGRNGLMILIAYECGLRASELLGIRVKDFSPVSHTVFIRSLKGSNARELPLKPSRSRQLKKHVLGLYSADQWQDLDADALLFPISYPRLWQVWDFYRPNKERGFHCLRHCFALELYNRTKDIKVVQLALGHRNITNTMVYVDFWYTQNALRKLMHG